MGALDEGWVKKVERRERMLGDLDLHDDLGIEPTPRGNASRPPTTTAFKIPAPPPYLVVFRFWLWFIALLRLTLRVGIDKLRGKDTTERRAVHVRNLITSMGPLAIQVAQQISMRLDVLPLAYAAELSRLEDKAPRMRLQYAFERIQAATGHDVMETFEALDPEPIVSDSISCSYQAVLRTGEKVAVKVLRPRILRDLAAEHVVLDVVLRMVSMTTNIRADYLRNLRNELQPLMFEAVNFIRIGRIQEMFRKEAKKHRLKYLTCSRVKFNSADVIVSEFVSGVWLDEVVAAVENDDKEALARLKEMGITPKMCGRRLLHSCWWGFFEGTMFANLEEATQIVVQPGGKLAFIALGHTGNLDRHHRRLLTIALERMAKHDVKNAVELLLQLFQPLPRIDLNEFTKEMENRIWARIFAMENRDAPWWERTGTALWLEVLDTARAYDVPVPTSIARMMQSACLFDHMAARLWPDFRVFKEFRRYRRESHIRQARLALRRARKQTRRNGALIEQARKVFEQVQLQGETMFENVPIEFAPVAKKGAYFATQVLVLIVGVAKLTVAMFVGRMLYTYYQTRVWEPAASIEWVRSFPVYLALSFFLVILTIRRLLFRLSDMDQDND